MTSLIKRLFSTDDRFFGLLEASAEEGCESVAALAQIVANRPPLTSLEKILRSREKENQIGAEIHTLLCQGHSAPLEHYDIEVLARALYRIPKGTKKFPERYLVCSAHVQEVSFHPQVQTLESATRTVSKMVSDLRRGRNLSAAKTHNDELQRIESEADERLIVSLDQLCQPEQDPLKAVMLKDLYELLEKVFDRCRTAGNVILQIELKRS